MTDAEDRYAEAQKLVESARKQWYAEGCPLTTEGGATGRAVVPHPLVKMLSEALSLADRLERALKKSHRGPAPSAVEDGETLKPAGKLRAVR